MAARTETERELAALAAEMLGVARIGVTDDFFTLGGHSLLAMRLVARCNERYAADVALRQFLRAPTIARLASEVDATRGAALSGGIGIKQAHDGRLPHGRRQAHADQRLLDRLEELSDDEVDALLRDMAEDEVER